MKGRGEDTKELENKGEEKKEEETKGKGGRGTEGVERRATEERREEMR